VATRQDKEFAKLEAALMGLAHARARFPAKPQRAKSAHRTREAQLEDATGWALAQFDSVRIAIALYEPVPDEIPEGAGFTAATRVQVLRQIAENPNEKAKERIEATRELDRISALVASFHPEVVEELHRPGQGPQRHPISDPLVEGPYKLRSKGP
jgi:hypothetical protein